MNPPTILVIEDDDFQYEIYEEALAKYKLVRVTSCSEALAQMPRISPNLLILDHVLGKGELGLDFLRKHGEAEPVLQAVAAHHMDIDWPSLEAMIVQAADAISAARPGARRDILESYVKRLEKLEGIADSFKGVSKSFALQAGREIRIMVESEKISDEEAVWLSKDIARRIENELEYPGQIKVTVIRETRAVDYAK